LREGGTRSIFLVYVLWKPVKDKPDVIVVRPNIIQSLSGGRLEALAKNLIEKRGNCPRNLNRRREDRGEASW